MKVEIGGGTNPRAGYRNFDPMESGEWGGRLGYDRVPVFDGAVSAVYASHVMEHIPQGQPRIDAFNEVWRILRPGGIFEVIVPCVGYTAHPAVPGVLTFVGNYPDWTPDRLPHYAGWQPWADPTHVSFWWFPESFWYFCNPAFQANADYGKKMWDPGLMEMHDGWEAHVTLYKPKEAS